MLGKIGLFYLKLRNDFMWIALVSCYIDIYGSIVFSFCGVNISDLSDGNWNPSDLGRLYKDYKEDKDE